MSLAYNSKGVAIELPKKDEEVPMGQIYNLLVWKDRLDVWERIRDRPPTKPFSSDGASCFPDKIGDVDIYAQAVFHDIEYWVGGTAEERVMADCRLVMDALRAGASAKVARSLFIGCSFGGVSWLPTSWRWGFGQ